MSQTVNESFVRQYETDVHVAFQRMGTLLLGTTRYKPSITGKSTTFQKVGKGAATQKTRHGDITPMNLDHTPIELTLGDWYAGDFIDELDLEKLVHDERQVVINAGAYALGRKIDDLIIDGLEETTTSVGDYTTGLSRKLVLDAIERAHVNDWPDDGQWFAAVAPHAWGELMRLDEFSRSEWVGGDGQPWKTGKRYREWLGIKWMQHQALPLANSDDRDCYLYHKTAIGAASGSEIKSDITWQGTKAAWWAMNYMSMGAKLIDANGVIEIRVDDDVAYT